MKRYVLSALLAVISVFALAGVLMTGCGGNDATVTVDLYDYELLDIREYYDISFGDYLPQAERYGAYAEGLEFEVRQDSVRLYGLKEGVFDLYIGIDGGKTVKLLINIKSTADYNVLNGGFERGTTEGWTGDGLFGASSEVTFFDDLYMPVPEVGQDGWFFADSFGMDSGLSREGMTGTLKSSEFIASGSGYVTFKLGGGCGDGVFLALKEGDRTVAAFNNYMFCDPYRSLGLTEYYYKIPEECMGKKLYFELNDNEITDFGGITADSFRTYYRDIPDLTGIYEAKLSSTANTADSWIKYEGGNGTSRMYSPYFTVTENLSFTLKGGRANGLKLRLVTEKGDDIAVFNNWRKSESDYIYVNSSLKGKRVRFILDDTDVSDGLEVVRFGMTADIPDDLTVFAAGYIQGQPYDLNNYLRPTEAGLMLDGEFEDLGSWFSVDLEGYNIYDDAQFFGDIYTKNPPVYGADGKFLTGCYFGVDMSGISGTGTLYSRTFTVGGSGFITFKLGGNNIETLYLKLMKYEEDGNHTEIARFNNYLFSDPYRSTALTKYGYQIPAKYMHSKCFFQLVDEESSAAYGALSIDSVKTYYAQAPALHTGGAAQITDSVNSITIAQDERVYPAGFMVPYFSDITQYLKLGEAGQSLKNGSFENGSAGWFSADPNAFSAYRVSSETTYFEAFYPNNIPVFNKTGTYFLNGFSNEAFRGSIYSEAFVANGWITFKLGGGNSENLKFKLMCYTDGVNDEEIAVFNNYLFSDPYRSMTMTRYAYKIPEKYNGKFCYFVIEDNSVTNFGAMTVDEIITRYDLPPVIDGKPSDDPKTDTTFKAGFRQEAYD